MRFVIKMGVEKYAKKEVAELMTRAGSSTRASVGHIEGMINLGAGDPDFNQPELINKAVYEAMKAGHTHYSFSGEPDFKEAIAKYYKKYDDALTPCDRLLASEHVTELQKTWLTEMRLNLDPYKLRAMIDTKQRFIFSKLR